jgi:hypothetical protein
MIIDIIWVVFCCEYSDLHRGNMKDFDNWVYIGDKYLPELHRVPVRRGTALSVYHILVEAKENCF